MSYQGGAGGQQAGGTGTPGAQPTPTPGYGGYGQGGEADLGAHDVGGPAPTTPGTAGGAPTGIIGAFVAVGALCVLMAIAFTIGTRM